MLVGTFSGVTSAGIVISSARGGTSSGNSSLTKDKISDVFPTPAASNKTKLNYITIKFTSYYPVSAREILEFLLAFF